jgi:hypothetical protein
MDDGHDNSGYLPQMQQITFGGGGDKLIMNSTMKQELGQALVVALRAIGDSTKCAGLFGLTNTQVGNTSPAPALVLSNLLPAGNVWQNFTFSGIPNNGKYVTSAITKGLGSAAVSVGNGATIAVNVSVQIILNNSSGGSAFVSGNVNDWAITLLHELGHVYWDLYGPGTSSILPDHGNPAQSLANTALIGKDCDLQGKLQ